MKRWTVNIYFIIFVKNFKNKLVRNPDLPHSLGPVIIHLTG